MDGSKTHMLLEKGDVEKIVFSKVILKVFFPNCGGKNSYKTSCHVYSLPCIEAAEVQMRTYIPQGQFVTFELTSFCVLDLDGQGKFHLIGYTSHRRISRLGLETVEVLLSRFNSYADDWRSIYMDMLCVHPSFRGLG